MHAADVFKTYGDNRKIKNIIKKLNLLPQNWCSKYSQLV